MFRLFLILILILGFASGWYIGQLAYQGYLTQWHQLPPPPSEIVSLTLAHGETVYAQSNQGTQYLCSEFDRTCWLVTTSPLPAASPASQHKKPCDTNQPAFSRLTSIPLSSRDCVQDTEIYADGSGRYLFILDDTNRIWQWSLVHSPYDFTTRLFPLLGLFAGSVLIVIITLGRWLWRWRRSLRAGEKQ